MMFTESEIEARRAAYLAEHPELKERLDYMGACVRFVEEHMETLGVAIAAWEDFPNATAEHQRHARTMLRELAAIRRLKGIPDENA